MLVMCCSSYQRALYITVVFILLQFREELHTPSEVKLGQLYAALSSYSSQWHRALVVQMLPEREVFHSQLL